MRFVYSVGVRVVTGYLNCWRHKLMPDPGAGTLIGKAGTSYEVDLFEHPIKGDLRTRCLALRVNDRVPSDDKSLHAYRFSCISTNSYFILFVLFIFSS